MAMKALFHGACRDCEFFFAVHHGDEFSEELFHVLDVFPSGDDLEQSSQILYERMVTKAHITIAILRAEVKKKRGNSREKKYPHGIRTIQPRKRTVALKQTSRNSYGSAGIYFHHRVHDTTRAHPPDAGVNLETARHGSEDHPKL